ncbi:hypothetical protein EDB92DRAFT_2104120 [Lactarius akahatsu]|uniref:MACPF domain-containing protein n=1 Tax=Lactarius akahatsu TaxID=416441 RepID=A0AAD4LJ07_9AGAM|nr:hypothetical protein EDB92DRAFT_2104120 [Lactarius akahatsu]
MSKFLALHRSPSAETFVAGMQPGTSVDGISGDMPASAFDPATTTSQQVVGDKTGTQYSLHVIEDLRELNVSEAFSTSGAITFAGGNIEGSVNTAFDLSQSHASTGRSILIVLRCEKHGLATRIGSVAKLTEAAKSLINNPSVFRERFGDYYVHEISHEARFTAVCVDAQGSGKFESQLKSAAKESNASIEVQYDILGDMGSAHIDVNASATDNLTLFDAKCVPVPSTVHLRHYCNIEPQIPRSIEMDPDLYLRTGTRKAFDDIRLAVLFNSTLPADGSSRIRRRRKIEELFREIHANRSGYSTNPQELSNVLNDLAGLLEEFNQILACHELITSLRNVSYDDAIRGHRIDHTDGTAAWVRSQKNIGTFSVGRTNPSAEDIKKYGIEHVSKGPGMESQRDYALLRQVWGSLAFPRGTGVDGAVIGFTVNSHWTDGTNGWWGIVPKTGPLGKKDLKVSVQSEGSRGMHKSPRLELTAVAFSYKHFCDSRTSNPESQTLDSHRSVVFWFSPGSNREPSVDITHCRFSVTAAHKAAHFKFMIVVVIRDLSGHGPPFARKRGRKRAMHTLSMSWGGPSPLPARFPRHHTWVWGMGDMRKGKRRKGAAREQKDGCTNVGGAKGTQATVMSRDSAHNREEYSRTYQLMRGRFGADYLTRITAAQDCQVMEASHSALNRRSWDRAALLCDFIYFSTSGATQDEVPREAFHQGLFASHKNGKAEVDYRQLWSGVCHGVTTTVPAVDLLKRQYTCAVSVGQAVYGLTIKKDVIVMEKFKCREKEHLRLKVLNKIGARNCAAN